MLEGCNVNDATVQVLAQNCMLLREVSIKGSLGCSDKSAEVLLQVVPSVLAFDFIFRSRLTYADVSALLLQPLLPHPFLKYQRPCNVGWLRTCSFFSKVFGNL